MISNLQNTHIVGTLSNLLGSLLAYVPSLKREIAHGMYSKENDNMWLRKG